MEDTCGFKSRRIFPSLIFIVIVRFASCGGPSFWICCVIVRSACAAIDKIVATSTTMILFTLVISGKGLPATGS